MIGAFIQIGAGLVMLGLILLGAHMILEPGRWPNIRLFGSWRADPWPRGVQEEDPVRFDLVGAERRRRARLAPRFPSTDIIATARADAPGMKSPTIEEASEAATGHRLEPLHAVVRRLRR